MRPLSLELEGFAAFRERCQIDFSDLDLVALVGPTGSGKSTLIDAMTFALYGSVARYDNTKLVAPVIHQLATEAKVRFDFELAGSHYVAVRIVRRTQAGAGGAPRATTKEARLERLDGPGSPGSPEGSTVLAGNVRDLDEAVRDLIGLDFSQFTRTIVLPQGEFAEFLRDDPSDRQALLRRLLDLGVYARMGSRAREAATDAARWATVRTEELDRLADATPAALAELSAAHAALSAFEADLPDRLARLDEVEADLVERRQAVTALDEVLGALAGVEVPDGLALTDQAVQAAEEAVDAARARRTAADAALVETRATVEALPPPATTQALLDQHHQRAEVGRALAALRAEVDTLRAEQEAWAATVASATTDLEAATRVAAEARAQAEAAPWVARLAVGDPCPICDQEVVALPIHHDRAAREPAAAVARAEDQVAAARNHRDEAQRSQATVQGRVDALDQDLAQRAKGADELDRALADQPGEDELTGQLRAASAAAERAEEAAAEVRRAEGVVSEADTALARARRANQDDRHRFTAQRDAVAALGPPPPGDRLLADWEALAQWATTEQSDRQARRAELGDEGKALARTKADLVDELSSAAQDLGLPPDLAELTGAVAARRARVDADIDQLRQRLDRRQGLEAEIAAHHDQQRVLESLGQHLSASGFERWLLAEALDDLVERATERMLELSRGRYSLEAVNGSFVVRDHTNADERRDVRTLSGGETFLASLSLALALSSSIAELATVDGPRLESIFLDEGFGTLDGDTLDLLASAIEELSAGGRLVCIVTHVRDLAERLPVRFEVRKGPTTATVERVEA